MGILKGILHHWNKTSSAYDTIHPETEVSQVTDWNSGIVNTLASTALGSLVTTLSSDSLLAKLIEKVLSATGVKYQTGTNGYLCLGSLFGGVIIQWGMSNTDINIIFPIPFTLTPALSATHKGSYRSTNIIINNISTTSVYFLNSSDNTNANVGWIAIGV